MGRAGLAVALWLPSLAASAACLPAPAYPPTRIDDVQDVYFGTTVPDPYRWLEDGRSPEVRAWVQAWNRASDRCLSGMGDTAALAARLKGLVETEHWGLPQRRGPWLFYSHQAPGQEQPQVLRQPAAGGPAQLLLDPNSWPRGRHAALGDWVPSPDGSRLAYIARLNNADRGELRVLDPATGRDTDRVDWADWGDLAWGPDSRGFYYTRLPKPGSGSDTELPGRADLAYHALGGDPAADPSVAPASGDAQVYSGPQVSDDGRWLFVVRSRGFSGTRIEARDLSVTAAPVIIFNDDSATAQVLEDQGRFLLLTHQGAPHGVVKAAPAGGPATALAWKTLVPERQDVFLDDARVVGHRLLLLSHWHAASRAELWSLDGRLERALALPGQGSVEEASGAAGDDGGFLSYQSFTQPPRVERFSADQSALEAWPSAGPAPAALAGARVEQVWVRSKDGTPVSMFLLRPAGQARDGRAPFVLEGYGGFGTPLLPRFWPALAALLEAGFGVAVPNLRGGGEYGEAWHRAGMLEQKQHCFDDFLAAADFLIDEHYTSAPRLAIWGSSNGGLLVAAALAQRPELFGAAVCSSPLTDMLRYPLFGEGPAWLSEYGDPRDEAQFRALAAYSPYHQLRPGRAYPPTLVVCAENDDRVDPLHARKFAAALRRAQAGPAPVLLRCLSHAGHAGAGEASGRERELAEELAFIEFETRCQDAPRP